MAKPAMPTAELTAPRTSMLRRRLLPGPHSGSRARLEGVMGVLYHRNSTTADSVQWRRTSVFEAVLQLRKLKIVAWGIEADLRFIHYCRLMLHNAGCAPKDPLTLHQPQQLRANVSAWPSQQLISGGVQEMRRMMLAIYCWVLFTRTCVSKRHLSLKQLDQPDANTGAVSATQLSPTRTIYRHIGLL